MFSVFQQFVRITTVISVIIPCDFSEPSVAEAGVIFERIKKAIAELIAKIKKAYKNVKPETLEGQIVASMLDEYETIQQMFVKALAGASENFKNAEVTEAKNTAEAVKFSIKEMGFEEFDKQTLNNIKMRKGVVLNSVSEMKSHIERALQNPQEKVNCYLGVISTSVKSKIEEDVGQKLFEENKPYTFVISYDDIQHISEHFNSVDKMVNEVLKVYEIIKDYDSVEFEIGKSNAKKLIFDKSYSDYDYRTVEIVSKSKSSLDLVTFFITKNNIKGSQSVPPATRGSLQRGSASDNRVPQNGTDVNTSISENGVKYSDRNYLEAVESDDMVTAQRMVDEAAEKAMPDSIIRGENGKLLNVYHGSLEKFTVFSHDKMNVNGNAHGRGFYFTEEKSMAEGYQKDGGQLLKGYLNITKPMSEEKVTIKKPDLVKYIKATCEQEARNLVADGSYDSVSDALPDTWVSNYVYTYGMSLDKAYMEVADIIYANDNDVDIIAEISNVAGTEIALKKAHEVLGYDGVVYTNDRGTHEYVALISNQFKSTEPVTYDDNGNVIPLSERFNSEESDIRYSGRNFVEDKYFSRQIDRFESLKQGGYVTVGKITKGSPLNMVGIPEGNLYFDVSKIVKEMKSRKDVIPPDKMKEIPKVLNNPIVITEYVDTNGNHSANVYGKLYIGSSPVVIGVMIAKSQKGNLVSKIQTVHPNRNVLKEMVDDNILYLSENKKETKAYFQSLGTQELPLGGIRFGFIRTISQMPDVVKRSDRDPEALTPRNLLANALEESAVNPVEKNKLAEYKKTSKCYAARSRSFMKCVRK